MNAMANICYTADYRDILTKTIQIKYIAFRHGICFTGGCTHIKILNLIFYIALFPYNLYLDNYSLASKKKIKGKHLFNTKT